jgi:hypothetical protein
MSSRRVALTAASFVAAMTFTAACDNGSDSEDGHFYCTDSTGTVIDESYCDDPDGSGGGYFFMYMGSSMHTPTTGSSYPVGSKLPAGAQKFQNTAVNRTKFGLPATGRITNGTVKTGVIGKGGPGSTAKSGS